MSATTGTTTTLVRIYRSDLIGIDDARNAARLGFMIAKVFNLVKVKVTDASKLRQAIIDVLTELKPDSNLLAMLEDAMATDNIWFRWDEALKPAQIKTGSSACAIFARQLRIAFRFKESDDQVDFALKALDVFAKDQAVVEAILDVLALSPLGEYAPAATTGQPAATATASPTTGMPVTPLTPTLGNAAATGTTP